MGVLRRLRRKGGKPVELGKFGVHAGSISGSPVQRFFNQVAGRSPTKEKILSVRSQINRFDAEFKKPGNSIPKLRRLWNELAVKGGAKIANRVTAEIEISKISQFGSINPTDRIASIGSGSALIETFIAKKLVPHGTVTCIDVSPEMNRLAKQAMGKAGVQNMAFFTRSGTKTGLPAASQDKVFAIRTVLTNTIHWQPLLQETRRIIKKTPDARFIVAFESRGSSETKQIKKSLEKNGFQPVHTITYATIKSLNVESAMIIAKPIPQQN